MNDRDALVNDMWMGIDDGRLAMGRPACVGDPRTTLYRRRKLGLLECRNTAQTLVAGQLPITVNQRKSRGVIAAVLEPAQTLKQNLGAVPPRSDGHDATH